jgi:hypothetical protein
LAFLEAIATASAPAAAQTPAPAAATTIPSLPFSIKADTSKLENPKPYMWIRPGVNMDFPLSSVRIGQEFWVIYANGDAPVAFRWKGTNVDDAEAQPNGSIKFPPGVARPYFFGNLWCDPADGKLYTPVHCEFHRPDGFTREVHLATSTDKGLTWTYVAPILTRHNAGGTMTDMRQQPGQTVDGGPGDMHLLVDARGGYIYMYAHVWSYVKKGAIDSDLPGHQVRYIVARCPIADKMAPDKWRKFYDGRWEEPGIGGRATSVRAVYVTYNDYLKKYVSFSFGSALAVCDDLSKQQWSRRQIMPGKWWGFGPNWGSIFLNEQKNDPQAAGNVLHIYAGYMKARTVQATRLELGEGRTPADQGYVISGMGYWGSPSAVIMDPEIPDELYPVSAQLESADPLQARRTRVLDADQVTFSGASGGAPWARMSSDAKGASITATFKAAQIYWRAYHDAAQGMADIYLDEKFQRTVNLYSPTPTASLLSFHKTGLDPKATHTIRIAVRGEKDPRSRGTSVSHKCFEYSAETWRAADGFSAVQGKEQWHYLHGAAGAYEPMQFPLTEKAGLGRGRNHWSGSGEAAIGIAALMPVAGDDVVLKWVAPRDGTVRVEGDPSGGEAGVVAGISKNNEQLWPMQPPGKSHDMKAAVKKGDGLLFVARQTASGGTNPAETKPADPKKASPKAGASKTIRWDPRVTYVEGD